MFLGFFRFYSNQIVHLVIDIAFSNIAAIKFDFYCCRSGTMEFIDDVDDDRRQRRLTQNGPEYAIQTGRISSVPDLIGTVPLSYLHGFCSASRADTSGSFDSIRIWPEQCASRLLLVRGTKGLKVRCGHPAYTICPGALGWSESVIFFLCLLFSYFRQYSHTHTHTRIARIYASYTDVFPYILFPTLFRLL